jgi:Domain of unknown function (DUF2017)
VSGFRRTRDGVTVALDAVETAILAQVMGELTQLVGPEPAAAGGEAWAQELGLGGLGELPEGVTPPPPIDPIHARLFPDAYPDDAAAAGDFRRFTEADLRAGKRANAAAFLGSLPDGGGSVDLDDEGCASWLGALNDARLALGTALDVDENSYDELALLEVDEPRAQRLGVYLWLGDLQYSLLEAITGD